MKYFIRAVVIVSFCFMSACNSANQASEPSVNSSAENPPEVIDQILPTQPSPELLPSATPEPTAPPAPVTLTAKVAAVAINMRSGPGTLHTVLAQYREGANVTLKGVAPGDEWAKVITEDGRTGWMSVAHLNIDGDVSALPEIPINESLVITGKVVDASGMGIAGIGIAAFYQQRRVDGTTLQNGVFYAYAPPELQGEWLISVVGVSCTSPIVDSNCRYAGTFQPQAGILLKLPQDAEVTFTYQ